MMAEFSAVPGDLNLDNLLGGRVALDPETVEKGLVKLVLMVVETLRQVIEKQAIRRVEGGTLTETEIENLGLTLMRLEAQMTKLRETFGLTEDDLSLRIPLPLTLE